MAALMLEKWRKETQLDPQDLRAPGEERDSLDSLIIMGYPVYTYLCSDKSDSIYQTVFFVDGWNDLYDDHFIVVLSD